MNFREVPYSLYVEQDLNQIEQKLILHLKRANA